MATAKSKVVAKKGASPTKGKAPVKAPEKAKPASKVLKTPVKKGKEKEKSKWEVVTTPIGRFSYPYLSKPKTSLNGEDYFSTDLLIEKSVWAKDPAAQKLKDAIISCAEANGLGDDMDDFKHPLVDMGADDDCPEGFDQYIKISAKTKADNGVLIVGPRKDPETGRFEELSEKEVKALKGGDWGRLRIAIAYYDAAGNEGITFYLQLVQYKEEGEAFGGGKAAALAELDELEVTEDDLEESSEEETEEEESSEEETEEEVEEEEEEAPKKKSSGKKGFSF